MKEKADLFIYGNPWKTDDTTLKIAEETCIYSNSWEVGDTALKIAEKTCIYVAINGKLMMLL